MSEKHEKIVVCPHCGESILLSNEPAAYTVIEFYYRSRAAGGKPTLKQLAEQYGFNYSYLRAAKSAYDAAGKWGSRK